MATIDLGKVALVWKGTYAAGTTYESKDVVQFTDSGEVSSYIYVNASGASGQTPSTGGTVNTTYWDKMAGGAAGIWASGLSLGTAGQVVKVNSSANALEFGAGFDGTYKLHAFDSYRNNSQVEVTTVANGTADNQRDCIVINGGNYLTITPSHADDLFEFKGGINYYLPQNAAYGGLGFQSSTATDFSANRNVFFQSGQHSMGSGGGQVFDFYQFKWINYSGKCSDLGLTAGTTYYVRAIGQKHSTGGTLRFNGNHGNNTDGRHYVYVNHWKKQT